MYATTTRGRLIERLVQRPDLVVEIDADVAAEIIICAHAMGVPIPRERALFDDALQAWRSVQQRGNPANRHYLQHVAVNLLVAACHFPDVE